MKIEEMLEKLPEEQRLVVAREIQSTQFQAANLLANELGIAADQHIDRINDAAIAASADVLMLQGVLQWIVQGGIPGEKLYMEVVKESSLAGVSPMSHVALKAGHNPLLGESLGPDEFIHFNFIYGILTSPLARARMYFKGYRLRFAFEGRKEESDDE